VAWVDFGLKALALVGVAVAALTFWRTAKVRRAEWLSSLHTKFYEGSGYKRIRRILDNAKTEPGFAQLRSAIESGQSTDVVEEFEDYLNFFEFVATLRNLGQLRSAEITMMFDYYLRLLREHTFIVNYIREYGFEGLNKLPDECAESK